MSLRLKNILSVVIDMGIESAKCLSNPHAGGSLSDVVKDPAKHEENDGETE